MVDAICKELIIRKEESRNTIQTIYFGGGTPSLLSTNELQRIFNTIHNNYIISPQAEITIEVNPDDFFNKNHLSLEDLKLLNINRLSIGIQSFFDEHLSLMNRSHNSEQAKEVLKKSTKYFDNITIDLIYAIPNMSNEQWIKNIQTALDFGIPHLSAYALTIEPNTAFDRFIKNGKLPKIDDEQAFSQFHILKNMLEENKFIHYELSNFGKKGYFSKNNTAYWEQKNYMGIGPSAHSYNGKQRSWNIAHNIKYIQEIEQGKRPFEYENLSEQDLYNEFIITRIRTQKGIPLEKIKTFFGEKMFSYLLKQAKIHLENELLCIENQHLKTTNKGLFLSDSLSRDLMI